MQFSSEDLYVGTFSCALDEPTWKQDHLHDRLTVGFPTAVARFKWEDGHRSVANRNHVLFHDATYSYRIIDAGSAYGSVYIVPSEHLVEELARELELDIGDGCTGFPIRHATLGAANYLALHQLRMRMSSPSPPDPLECEELLLNLLERVIRACLPAAGRSPSPDHAEFVEAAKEIISDRLADRMSLNQIAAEVHLSRYHLCRVFRRLTGLSIHEYRTHLRLREGLAALVEGPSDVSTVAFDLGFSSHGHFTRRFREVFGVTPSTARKGAL